MFIETYYNKKIYSFNTQNPFVTSNMYDILKWLLDLSYFYSN